MPGSRPSVRFGVFVKEVFVNSIVSIFLSLFSVIVPAKMWFAPGQAIEVSNTSGAAVVLNLTDFAGRPLATSGDATLGAGASADLRKLFADVSNPGTYVVWAVPTGQAWPTFVGTPIVVEVRADTRRGAPAGPMVTKLEPLRFATMSTDAGDVTAVFYYDVAPVTVASFLNLIDQGFYDGLAFHRVVPGFVIQGGDPRGLDPDVTARGSGSPGFNVVAEFNNKPHAAGVLSMARSGDPNERSGALPRPEFANSAGSQFFVCLDEENTQQLNGRYTAYGVVTNGMEVVKKIAAAPLADEASGRPVAPVVIKSARSFTVTPEQNPYATLFGMKDSPTTTPIGAP